LKLKGKKEIKKIKIFFEKKKKKIFGKKIFWGKKSRALAGQRPHRRCVSV
jgi:hypothetical protein